MHSTSQGLHICKFIDDSIGVNPHPPGIEGGRSVHTWTNTYLCFSRYVHRPSYKYTRLLCRINIGQPHLVAQMKISSKNNSPSYSVLRIYFHSPGQRFSPAHRRGEHKSQFWQTVGHAEYPAIDGSLLLFREPPVSAGSPLLQDGSGRFGCFRFLGSKPRDMHAKE